MGVDVTPVVPRHARREFRWPEKRWRWLALAVGVPAVGLWLRRPVSPRSLMEGEHARTYLDDLVASSKVPGIQYLVVNSSDVLFEYAGGWSDMSEPTPMNPTTTLMAYSMSKTITAAAVLRLAEEGSLGLDDPVSDYVDALPYPSDLTVRRLLTHTGGVPNPIPLRWAHLAPEHDRFDERAALDAQLQKNKDLSSDPGAKYAYSNLGYWLLGPVVERASGRPFTWSSTEG